MADEVRNYLTSEIETLRSAVFRAGALNAKALGQAAETHLENVLRFVTISQDVEDATFCCVMQIAAFARALYGQAPIGDIEQARRQALTAIDALADVVARSVPNAPVHPGGARYADCQPADAMAPYAG